LQREETMLRYVSVLIGSGVVQNEYDLTSVQLVFLKLKGIKPVEVQLKSNEKSRDSGTPKRLSNRVINSRESEGLGGFSFDLPAEQELVSDFGMQFELNLEDE
jgi:hypothetical protein